MREVWAVLATVLGLVVAACSGGTEQTALRPVTTGAPVSAPATTAAADVVVPTTTVTPTSSPPTTGPAPAETAPPTTVDEWAIPPPEEIDEAYVQRVLTELDRIHGDILRDAVAGGTVDEEIEARLAAIYHDFELFVSTASMEEFVAGGGSSPGDRRTEVERIVRSTEAGGVRCVVVNARIDYSAVAGNDVVAPVDIALRSDDGTASPTGWQIATLAPRSEGEDGCVF